MIAHEYKKQNDHIKQQKHKSNLHGVKLEGTVQNLGGLDHKFVLETPNILGQILIIAHQVCIILIRVHIQQASLTVCKTRSHSTTTTSMQHKHEKEKVRNQKLCMLLGTRSTNNPQRRRHTTTRNENEKKTRMQGGLQNDQKVQW